MLWRVEESRKEAAEFRKEFAANFGKVDASYKFDKESSANFGKVDANYGFDRVFTKLDNLAEAVTLARWEIARLSAAYSTDCTSSSAA